MVVKLPTYRRHKPSGQAVLTLNAKDFYLGPFGSKASRAKYDQLLAEWISNGRQLPRSVVGVDRTIAEIVSAYLAHAKVYYANDGETTSEYSCMKDAVRPLCELYSRTVAKDFGPLALKAVRQRMIDAGICRRQINQRTNRLRRVFKWAVGNELIPPSVLEGLRAVEPLKKGRTTAPESKPVRPVADADVDAILPFVSRQVAAMIQLQRLTGMRPGEVVLLRPCDVDRSDAVWVFEPAKHKTAYRDRQRPIFIGPRAQLVLAPWLTRDPECHCFSPAEAEAERNTLRRAKRKSPMTPSQAKRKPKSTPKRPKQDRYKVASYRRAISYGIKAAGVSNWHPHQLRHNCGTEYRREFGLDVAQIVLGHASADMTQVYAAADRTRAVAAVAKSG